MAYQVLARQWRPRNFPEMVGQTHVLRALTNALDNNRLHHAYLFTGTRGVGKTTIARILAKSLNCTAHATVTAYPCGQCNTCREIDEGRFVDLIEVDAASRTKVEDTRELLENVQYAPTRGRYKVYLIDEVHMLSTHSFNALLKTLEEPPPHVKFLLATTDPQKLPPTILSRCLQFNLKRLSLDLIIQQLTKIVEEEKIPYEPAALRLLAQAADGSMRDGLSLLDQAIAYSAGHLASNDVGSMLGTLDQHTIIELVTTLANNDAIGLLQRIAQLAEQNPDYVNVLGDMLSLLQRIALAQIVRETVDINQNDSEIILKLADQLLPEEVQLFYQIGLLGRRDLPLAPEPRGGFEMVLLRMLAFRPAAVEAVQPTTATSAAQSTTVRPVHQQSVPTPERSPAVITETLVTPANSEWTTIIQRLPLAGLVRELAFNCALKRQEGNTLFLVLPPAKQFLRMRKDELENLLKQHYDESWRIMLSIEEPTADTPAVQEQRVQDTQQQTIKANAEADSFVVEMQKDCDAKIINVRPLNENP